MAITRPPWPPKIINLISAGLFLVLTLIGFLGNRSIDGWLFDWASGLVTLTIGLLLLVTMPIMPFTEQYARERVPREYWGRPTFKKVNGVLSIGILVFMVRFTAIYPDRARKAAGVAQEPQPVDPPSRSASA
jgi:hypothetical protein